MTDPAVIPGMRMPESGNMRNRGPENEKAERAIDSWQRASSLHTMTEFLTCGRNKVKHSARRLRMREQLFPPMSTERGSVMPIITRGYDETAAEGSLEGWSLTEPRLMYATPAQSKRSVG